MNDTEKVAMLKQMLSDFWECEPSENEMRCGAYYGLLTAIGSVVYMGEDNE